MIVDSPGLLWLLLFAPLLNYVDYDLVACNVRI
jgi:hypothetical protein